jgi:hypothetical protein
MPVWDVDARVPLYSGSFRLVDLLDSTLFHIQPDSTVSFALNVRVDTVTPGRALDVFAVNSDARLGLSDFLFKGLGAGSLPLDLSELTGIPIPDSGAKARLEPFRQTLTRTCGIPGVSELEILDGVARVRATNYTSLDFDTLVVTSPVGRIVFTDLGPGQSRARRLDVGGAVVTSPMTLDLLVASPGTSGDTVQLHKHDSVVVQFELDSLHVAGGRMKIPFAEGRRRCQVGLGSKYAFRIDSVTVSAGVCGLAIENQFPVPVDVTLEVPVLKVNSRYHIPAKQSVTADLGLTGLDLNNRSRVNSLFDFYVRGVPDTSAGEVWLAKSDGLHVSYQTTGLGTERVAGEFREPVYVKSRLDTLPRLPFGIHGLRVADAQLVLDLESGIGFPLDLQLKFVAFRSGEPLHTLEQQVMVQPGQPDQPVHTQCAIDMTGLINSGPDYITLEQHTRILGRGSSDTRAYVCGDAVLSTPMRLAFVPDTVATPAKAVPMNESQRRLVNDYLVGAEATLSVANRLPVGFCGRLVLKPDPGATPNPATLVDSVVIPFGVPAGVVNRQGLCLGSTDTTLCLEIDSADVSLLRTWPLQAAVLFETQRTDTVTVLTTDRISVNALLNLRVRVKE